MKQGLTLDDGQHSMRPVQGDRQAQSLQELPLVQQVSQLLLSGRHEARQGEANGSWNPQAFGELLAGARGPRANLKAANPPKAGEKGPAIFPGFTGGVFSMPQFYPHSSVVLAIELLPQP